VLAGTEYEDFRYPIDVKAGFKKPEFDAEQAKGTFAVNLGRVPILQIGDEQIGQTKAIEMYVAKRFGFMGANDIEAGQIMAIGEHISDINAAYQKVRGIADASEKAAAMDKWFSEELKTWLGKLEKAIAITTKASGCSVGSKMSYADILIWSFVTDFFDNKEGVKASMAGCTNILAVQEAVGKDAKIAAWVAKRPVTDI